MSKSKDGHSNHLFLKQNEHSDMMHMFITDKSYLEHMIHHHQEAIDDQMIIS